MLLKHQRNHRGSMVLQALVLTALMFSIGAAGLTMAERSTRIAQTYTEKMAFESTVDRLRFELADGNTCGRRLSIAGGLYPILAGPVSPVAPMRIDVQLLNADGGAVMSVGPLTAPLDGVVYTRMTLDFKQPFGPTVPDIDAQWQTRRFLAELVIDAERAGFRRPGGQPVRNVSYLGSPVLRASIPIMLDVYNSATRQVLVGRRLVTQPNPNFRRLAMCSVRPDLTRTNPVSSSSDNTSIHCLDRNGQVIPWDAPPATPGDPPRRSFRCRMPAFDPRLQDAFCPFGWTPGPPGEYGGLRIAIGCH